MQENPLADKVALVTGAARRIGAEISRTLHHAGMNIVIHYNESEAEAQALNQQLNQKRPHSAVVVRASLDEADSEKALIKQALAGWGRIDALVNNASRFYKTPMGEVTDYSWEDLMNSNLKAPFFLSQAAAPALASVQGCIVNITDIHAETPLEEYPIYCISKSGLVMMTKVLAKELGPAIRVNAISPGPIIWPEGKSAYSEKQKKKIVEETVLQRTGSPEDIAKAVLFFIRDAGFISGQVLNIDGGRSI